MKTIKNRRKACIHQTNAGFHIGNIQFYFTMRAQVIASALGPTWQDAQRGNLLQERKVTFGKISFKAVNSCCAAAALLVCSPESLRMTALIENRKRACWFPNTLLNFIEIRMTPAR